MRNVSSPLLCLALLLAASAAEASTVTVIGKLVDRQCSVEDVYQLQPQTEKYCTLTIEETRVVFGVPYVKRFTIYCPYKTIDGLARQAYVTCSDPSAMQIRHPTINYSITGELRSVAEQADGKGQILGNGFQW